MYSQHFDADLMEGVDINIIEGVALARTASVAIYVDVDLNIEGRSLWDRGSFWRECSQNSVF